MTIGELGIKGAELATKLDQLRQSIPEQILKETHLINEARSELRGDLADQGRNKPQWFMTSAHYWRLHESRLKQKDAMAAQAEVDAIRSTGYVVATLLPDKVAGRRIGAIINAGLDLRQAIKAYDRNLNALTGSTSSIASEASSAILTGNILSIGLVLSPHFRTEGPYSDQQILSAIAQLSQQISDFQNDVRDRFDHVDAGLNAIYGQVAVGFAEVKELLTKIHADTEATGRVLDRIVAQLDYNQRDVVSRLDYLLSADFKKSMSKCLKYKN